MSGFIYIEGGGESKELHSRCWEGFHKLLQKSGFKGRMPRLVACGGRSATFDSFKAGHKQKGNGYVAMLIDSEKPLDDVEAVWQHLSKHDFWSKPVGIQDEQVLLMTTCMETWVIADRETLSEHYGTDLQVSALPSLDDLEKISPDEVYHTCPNWRL